MLALGCFDHKSSEVAQFCGQEFLRTCHQPHGGHPSMAEMKLAQFLSMRGVGEMKVVKGRGRLGHLSSAMLIGDSALDVCWDGHLVFVRGGCPYSHEVLGQPALLSLCLGNVWGCFGLAGQCAFGTPSLGLSGGEPTPASDRSGPHPWQAASGSLLRSRTSEWVNSTTCTFHSKGTFPIRSRKPPETQGKPVVGKNDG